jgi:hypothetical protein
MALSFLIEFAGKVLRIFVGKPTPHLRWGREAPLRTPVFQRPLIILERKGICPKRKHY